MTTDSTTRFPHTRYCNAEAWQASVPADLIPALEHLRKSFDDAHWGCGQTTRLFCYALLHETIANDPKEEHLEYLRFIKGRVGSQVTSEFNRGLGSGNQASIFRAFYDLYVEGVLVQALQTCKDLIDIAMANRSKLASPLRWAALQSSSIIRDERHVIRLWVKNVCDKQPYDADDKDESIYWRKWRAPEFLIMWPNGNRSFGFPTYWANRLGTATEELGVGPDVTSQDLSSLLSFTDAL